MDVEEGCAYLLDQHVEVLGDVGCEACMSLCQSWKTKAEALLSDSTAMDGYIPPPLQEAVMSSTPPARLARQRGMRVPFDLRILRILLPAPSCQHTRSQRTTHKLQRFIPVTTLTWATPWLSRNTTPICDGVAPFFASLQMLSTTWSGVLLNHVGTEREYGIAEALMPLPLL
jgi:hypothetical protein